MNNKLSEEEKINLIQEFISGTKNFWKEDKRLIDIKHLKILNTFEKKYKNNIKLYSKELVDWEGQTNLGSPFQINTQKIKYLGFLQTFKHVIQNIKTANLTKYFNKISFFDDIQIIKKNNGLNIMKSFPLHKKTDFKDFYFLSDEISTNKRWNRYIYLASQIKRYKFLNNENKNWLDIGSYYGGL